LSNLVKEIRTRLIEKFPTIGENDILISTPPDIKMGDIAIPLFALSKKLNIPLPSLSELCIPIVDVKPYVVKVERAGGYLNLFLDRNIIAGEIVKQVFSEKDRYGALGTGIGKRALIEHTSINPNASPHVGRARNAMVGDCLSRLFRFEGYDTEVHYYVNDMGRQIGLLVLIADEIENLDFDGILQAYVRANQRAENDPEFAQKGYELLAKMEQGDEEVRKKFFKVTEMCLKGQLQVLSRLGVDYDYFDRESNFIESEELNKVLEMLKEKGALFIDEENRLTVDLSMLGYSYEEGRYFVLRRANGSSMYGYRDLAYTIYKGHRGTNENLIVLGEDHKLYFQQISLILSSAGYKIPTPVFYSYILLKTGKMSTRQGNVVLLSDFLDEASSLALKRVEEQCKELSTGEQKLIAEQVAVSAIRFTVLRVTPLKNVIFDMDSALSFEGDTGPYLQYSCARIKSILRKYERDVPEDISDRFTIQQDEEWILLRKIFDFPATISNSVEQHNPAIIAGFALDLAHAFTSFYHACPVLYAEDEETIKTRIQICWATLQTMQNALNLLGIPVPERM